MPDFFIYAAIVSLILVTGSTIYQRDRQRKMMHKAQEEADKQKGFQFVNESTAAPVNVFYGRNKVGGTRVFTQVLDYYKWGELSPTDRWDKFLSIGDSHSSKRVGVISVTKISATDPTTGHIYEHDYSPALNATVGATTLSLSLGTLLQIDSDVFTNHVNYNTYPPIYITLYHTPLLPDSSGNISTNPEAFKEYKVLAWDPVNFILQVSLPNGIQTVSSGASTLKESLKFESGDHNWDNATGSVQSWDPGTYEFLYVQQVIGYGGINKVLWVDIDDKDWRDPVWNRDTPKGSIRIHTYYDGTVADPMIVNSMAVGVTRGDPNAVGTTRDTAVFTNTAYASMCFRLHRNDPQWQSVPTVLFYVEGMRVRPILSSSSIGSTKVYSNNPAECLLDYLTNPIYGKALLDTQIDIASFYKAKLICDRKVPIGTSGLNSVDKNGKIWANNDSDRYIKLFECNLGIDTSKSVRSNIELILETMSGAELVWSGDKYKLQLEYPMVFSTQSTVYNASGSHSIQLTTGNFHEGDVVQYTIPGSIPDLFRCIVSGSTGTNVAPGLMSIGGNDTRWARDVVSAYITDADIIRDENVTQSWPNAQDKLNYFTVKFLNESKNFEEDSISWPSKTPGSSERLNVYEPWLTKDGMPLENETFQSGDTTEWHAKATAEEKVRSSRVQVIFKLAVPIQYAYLEPGDFVSIYSDVLQIPGELCRVEEVSVNDKNQATLQLIKFDASFSAWNAKDDEVVISRDIYDSSLRNVPEPLVYTVDTVNSTGASTSGILSWTSPNDPRVIKYVVKITTVPISSINKDTAWITLGETTGLSFEVKDIKTDKYVFTVVSVDKDGVEAPFQVMSGGNHWPLLSSDVLSVSFASPLYYLVVGASVITSTDNLQFAPNPVHITAMQSVNSVISQMSSCYIRVEKLNAAGSIVGSPDTIIVVDSDYHITYDATVVLFRIKLYDKDPGFGGVLLDQEELSVNSPTTAIIDLSNDYAYIPTDASGNNPVLSNATTTAKVFRGQIDESSSWSFSWVANNCTLNTTSGATVSITAISSDTATATCTATRSGYTSLTAIFNAIKIKQGIAGVKYTLVVDGQFINTTDSLTYNPNSLVIKSYMVDGTTQTLMSNCSVVISEMYGGTTNYTTAPNSSNSFTYTLPAYNKSTTAYVVKLSNSGGTLLDQLMIPVNPPNVALLTLSNPNCVVATDSAGNNPVLSGSSITTTAKVIRGSVDETSKWSLSWSSTGCTYSLTGNTVTITGLSADTASITCTATPLSTTPGVTQSLIFAISKSKTGSTGSTGNKSAVVNLYQWGSNSPPSYPTEFSTTSFNWGTLTHSGSIQGYDAVGIWSASVDANTNPNAVLWTVEKTISAAYNYTGSANVTWLVNTYNRYAVASNGSQGPIGNTGPSGQNFAQIKVYKWATSPAGAGTPTNTLRYTWGNSKPISKPGTDDDGWSVDVGSSAAGSTCWEASTWVSAAQGTTYTDTVAGQSWSIVAVGYGGSNGTNGTNGIAGKSSRKAFNKYTSVISPTTVVTVTGDSKPAQNADDNTDGTKRWGIIWPVAWSDSPPTLANNEYLYVAEGVYDPTLATPATTWQPPYLATLKVGQLSAVAVNTGSLTVDGNITVGGGGNIKITAGALWSNQFFVNGYGNPALTSPWEYPPASYVINGQTTKFGMMYLDQFLFRVGNQSAYLDWNSSTGKLQIKGELVGTSGTFSGTLTASKIVTTDNMQDNSITNGGGATGNPNIYMNPWPISGGTSKIYNTTDIVVDVTSRILVSGVILVDWDAWMANPNSIWIGWGWYDGVTYHEIQDFEQVNTSTYISGGGYTNSGKQMISFNGHTSGVIGLASKNYKVSGYVALMYNSNLGAGWYLLKGYSISAIVMRK